MEGAPVEEFHTIIQAKFRNALSGTQVLNSANPGMIKSANRLGLSGKIGFRTIFQEQSRAD